MSDLVYEKLQENLLGYLNDEQVKRVDQAYNLARKAHEGQFRRSGEPFIIHPVEVAQILSDIHMDEQSIIAAILHDVIEDTYIQKEEIAKIFGTGIASIVDGLSKLTQVEYSSRAEQQAENFRKMILAMSEDIRVILIKLADRLHNMRTLGSMPEEKKKRIASETLEIYAPIANRLGMYQFRREFEELSFFYLHPEKYEHILKTISYNENQDKLEIVQDFIKSKLLEKNVKLFRVWGKKKSLYSLYRKMLKKHLNFNEISDLFTFRIVVENVEDCYLALGVIHNTFKPLPGKFKDYIALPKTNGYQSLHTKVIGPTGTPLEIQIKTSVMNNIAEKGIVSYWQPGNTNEVEIRLHNNPHHSLAKKWVAEMVSMQKVLKNPIEFINNIKIDLYPDEVYIFTPTGKIISLPQNSTAVDFAYAVHTDVGNSCVASRINRKLMPLSTRLTSGQTVEVITADGSHPNPTWLNHVVTGKAIGSIKHWLKKQREKSTESLGMDLLNRSIKSLTDEIIDEEIYLKLCDDLEIPSINKLYSELGKGNLVSSVIAYRLVNPKENPIDADSVKLYTSALSLKGSEGLAVQYAACCYPIPNDRIMGVLVDKHGIVVHKEECKTIKDTSISQARKLHIKWDEGISGVFNVDLTVDVINASGVLASLSSIIAKEKANIVSINAAEVVGEHTIVKFILSIKDSKQLDSIIYSIKGLPSTYKVYRG